MAGNGEAVLVVMGRSFQKGLPLQLSQYRRITVETVVINLLIEMGEPFDQDDGDRGHEG